MNGSKLVGLVCFSCFVAGVVFYDSCLATEKSICIFVRHRARYKEASYILVRRTVTNSVVFSVVPPQASSEKKQFCQGGDKNNIVHVTRPRPPIKPQHNAQLSSSFADFPTNMALPR